MLQDKIKAELIASMKAKNNVKTATIRLIVAAMKEKEINLKMQGKEPKISDTELLNLLNSIVKNRKQTIAEYAKIGRDDYVKKETEELEIIQSFLPKPYSETEMQQIVEEILTSENITLKQDMKKVMSTLQGREDSTKFNMGFVANFLKNKLV